MILNYNDINQCIDILKTGGIVALPTETVYGLAANARNPSAISKIYALKNRPAFNPLIVHVHSVDAAKEIAEWNELSVHLSNIFHPGPLTIIRPLRENSGLASAVTAGKDTVAVRIPAHPLIREVIEKSGLALAAPSANPSGRLSPVTAAHVLSGFGENAPPVLDGGTCFQGVESTIVEISEREEITILRPGTITAEDIFNAVGIQPFFADLHAPVSAPGMLRSHYAPSVPVRLNVTENLGAGEAYLAFGAPQCATAPDLLFQLSEKRDLVEAARRLFQGLHALDRQKPDGIAVAPIPKIGIGHAIHDRLTRAAAKRD